VIFWYIFSLFGILYQEKSGNPGAVIFSVNRGTIPRFVGYTKNNDSTSLLFETNRHINVTYAGQVFRDLWGGIAKVSVSLGGLQMSPSLTKVLMYVYRCDLCWTGF
jgi:hypothetical protein